MTYENVNMVSPNMTGDRSNSYFYSFESIGNAVVFKQYKKSSPLDPINAVYPLDQDIYGTVECCQFDGYYYWSLERQTAGITIKKWELLSGIMYLRATYSFGNGSMLWFDSYSFAVDFYSSTLSLPVSAGLSYIEVSDGSKFLAGDTIVLGPSSVLGYINKYESATINSVVGNRLNLSIGLSNSFAAGNFVYANRYFYIFNEHAPYERNKGCLLKYKSRTGVLTDYAPSGMFKDVRASCFINDKILFIQGNSGIYLNSGDLGIYRYMAVDNLDYGRTNTLTTYALWAYSNAVYSLRSRYVFYSGGVWNYEDWFPKYNYVTSSTDPTVFFINVVAEPNMIHSVVAGLSPTSNIKISVLDQYLSPAVGKTVSLSSSSGSFSSSVGLTNTNGEFFTTFNGSSYIGDVTIRATVT